MNDISISSVGRITHISAVHQKLHLAEVDHKLPGCCVTLNVFDDDRAPISQGIHNLQAVWLIYLHGARLKCQMQMEMWRDAFHWLTRDWVITISVRQ